MKSLTFAQREVVDFIRAHIATEGYPPTRAEMARHFGINPNAIEDRLRGLRAKGAVFIKPGTARGITLPAPDTGAA